MSPHDAEDVASEAIIRAATYISLDVMRLDQFLVTAVKRICADQTRHDVRTQSLLGRLDRRPGVYSDQEDDAVGMLLVAGLIADARLTETEYAALALHLGHHRHAEIATRLNISVHACELALARAKRKLRSRITRPDRSCG